MTPELLAIAAGALLVGLLCGWFARGLPAFATDAEAFRRGFIAGVESRGGKEADVVDLRARRG